MLTNDKKQILDQIIASFSKEEIAWSSGYLAGIAGNSLGKIEIQKSIKDLTIFYITETGNSKFLATELAKKLKAQGTQAKLKASDQYRLTDFEKEKNFLVIASTHGEGEIPASGAKFFEHLLQSKGALGSMNYMVIALGDRNYPLFCEAGKKIDEQLAKLGAKKLAATIDLDLDFEDSIDEIFNQVKHAFAPDVSSAATSLPGKIKSSQKNFSGKIISNINLNDIGSSKETRHIEIEVDDEIHYEPGDSIGILFENSDLKVEGKITPRLYSVASSVNEHGNEVHLTVSVLRYLDENQKEVEGLFSGHLARLNVGEKINFYVSRNRQFKLPLDDKDIIMVGPGTGIAPFRAFLAERNYRGAAGKNWLFFGERNFQSDFLYQTEWQAYLESGLLSKMDAAFSRDQEEKIYVQDRIKEKSAEIYHWLENGAYFYVCGDKENMAQDVEKCLIQLIQSEGKLSEDEAKSYVAHLASQDRYLKDVY